MKKEKEIEDLGRHHQWQACLALQKAFDRSMVGDGPVNWGLLAEAAYHAGAAYALYQARV